SYVHKLATGRDIGRRLYHAAPAAIVFVYGLVALLLPAPLGGAFKDQLHDRLIKPALEFGVLVSLAGYSVAALKLLSRYRRWLGEQRSDAELYGARWIGRVLMALWLTLAALAGVRFYTWLVGELDAGPFFVWLGMCSAWLGVEGWRASERHFPTLS